MHALQATGLAKIYSGLFGRGAQHALRGLDLSVPPGTAFGLIGPNGAGKTTFIKTLLGVVRPSAGEVRVLGGSPEDPAIRRRIGYLPERLHLPASMQPAQFLAGVARLKGLSPGPAALEALLARVGLDEGASRKVSGFSKGMKQRLGLAAALLGAPELLVLDEPTDGIDPIGRMDVRRILAEERARGATLFLNSHLLSETERVCDRIGILAGGRLVREGPLEELCGTALRWTLRFAPGTRADTLTALGLEPTGPDLFHCDAADATALNALLDRARAEGALLVELGREGQELEQVLADAVGIERSPSVRTGDGRPLAVALVPGRREGAKVPEEAKVPSGPLKSSAR